MSYKLEIELFFFNAQTDYLPYFRTANITIEGTSRVQDLLESLRTTFDAFRFPETVVRINTVLVDNTVTINDVVARLGTTLTIEPASVFRATNDLCFDDSDFMQKYECLAPFCDEEDLAFYRTLYHTHYASEAFEYNRDYIGDAVIVLAHRLIRNGSEHRDAILDAVGDKANGIGLYEPEHNSLPAIDLSEKVAYLKGLLEARCVLNGEPFSKSKALLETLKQKMRPAEPGTPPALSLLSTRYKTQPAEDESTLGFLDRSVGIDTIASETVHPFKGFNIAMHYGTNAREKALGEKLIQMLQATPVDFKRATRAGGEAIVDDAPAVAYHKAGNILLDAFDANADIMVVDSERTRRHFIDKRCAKAVGREIDLQVITTAQLVAAATGTTDKKSLGLDDRSRITFL